MQVDTTDRGLLTRKTLKYLVIPRQEGTLELPSISFPYFDPESGTYKTAASDKFTLTVTKGKESAKPQTRYLTQEEISEVGHDIRYIKTDVKLRNERDMPYRNPLFISFIHGRF